MSRYVIGVDPGDSTGVAILREGQLFLVSQDEPAAATRLLETTLAHLRSAARQAAGDEVAVFVERYIGASRRAATRQTTAQEVIGEVRAICRQYGVAFTQQGAADAWACANNEQLRALGWYQRGRDVDRPDANDANMAIRHALLGLMKTQPAEFERLWRGGRTPD